MITDLHATRRDRRHDLDALRAVAMLLGIGLHAAMSFVPFPWAGSASIQGGALSCFKSDGLMSKCHNAFDCSAWKRTAGGWRVIRSWS